MLEERNLKNDLVALALLALTLFLALALFTYDPADPPGRLVYPPRAEVSNVCGPTGAWVAHLIFQGIGLGAYYLVISSGVAVSLLLGHRRATEPVLRTLGWLISLAGGTTLAAMALPGFSPGPVAGPGGYLGAAGRGWLEMHFATAGAYILVLSLIVGGLLLCTDYVLLRVSALLLGKPALRLGQGLVTGVRAISSQRGTKRTARSDVDDEEEEEDAEEASAGGKLKVRFHGKQADTDDEAEKDELEDETAEDESEEDEEADDEENAEGESTTGVKRLAEVLRIKPPKKKDAREEVIEQIEAVSRREDEEFDYELPSSELLLESEPFSFAEQEKDVRRKAKVLEKTFASFGLNVKVVEIETGPVIAQFEVELEAGLRLSKITSLADDLAIALRVPSVRVVAPIPGKNTVGVEVPNTERQLVRLREVMEEANGKALKMRIPIYLGKDVSGKPMVVDLASLPHLLIAGRTGTGKSVCLNSIIMSMLMTRRPEDVRMLLIDPKMVELSSYMRLPHLMHPVVTDMKKAEAILAWAVDKMEERYALLARAGVRHISSYNQLGEEEVMERLRPESEEEAEQIPTHLPYIVIVADEMADLMMTAAKEVEAHIIRLAQKSRAVGIHLILATQKPTVDVITGLIKSNLPARIAFQVASRTDSRVVLDEMGADKLLGNGDMLFLWPGTSTLLRGQGAFVSDDEINAVVDFVGTAEPQFVHELVHLPTAGQEGGAGAWNKNRDELYEAAVDVIVREGRGSVSLLQRALGVGYGRAARLIDFMAEDGIVGQYNGSQAREVLITVEQWQVMQAGGEPGAAAPPSGPKAAASGAKPAATPPAAPPERRGRYVLAKSRNPLDEEDEEEDEEEEYEDDEVDSSEADEEEDWDEEDDSYEEGEEEDEDVEEEEEDEDEAEEDALDEDDDEPDAGNYRVRRA